MASFIILIQIIIQFQSLPNHFHVLILNVPFRAKSNVEAAARNRIQTIKCPMHLFFQIFDWRSLVNIKLADYDLSYYFMHISQSLERSKPSFNNQLIWQSKFYCCFSVDLLLNQKLELGFTSALKFSFILIILNHFSPVFAKNCVFTLLHLSLHINNNKICLLHLKSFMIYSYLSVFWRS